MTQQGNDSSLPSPNLRVKVYGGDCDSGASNPSGESHPVEKTTKSSGSLDLGIDGAGKSPRNGNLKGKPKSNGKKKPPALSCYTSRTLPKSFIFLDSSP